jgi:hypothetical protein
MAKKRIIYRVVPLRGSSRHMGFVVVYRTRAISPAMRKPLAITMAVALAKANEPSQVVIHKRNGQIQSERTYPRSSDPRRSKG